MVKKRRYHNVCKVSAIPKGEARMFVVQETMIGIFHLDGGFFAIHDRCPHAGASLALGYLDGDVVSCRMHHWRFCVRSGACLDEEQSAADVQSYPVRVVGDQVQVEV